MPDRIQIFTRGKDIVTPDLVYDSAKENNEYDSASETLEKYRLINEKNMEDTIEERLKEILNSRNIETNEKSERGKLVEEMEMK